VDVVMALLCPKTAVLPPDIVSRQMLALVYLGSGRDV
jgi:hypothetical protein